MLHFFHNAVCVIICINFYMISDLYGWIDINSIYLCILPWNDIWVYGAIELGNGEMKSVSFQEEASNVVV